jgi:hypothetical protein
VKLTPPDFAALAFGADGTAKVADTMSAHRDQLDTLEQVNELANCYIVAAVAMVSNIAIYYCTVSWLLLYCYQHQLMITTLFLFVICLMNLQLLLKDNLLLVDSLCKHVPSTELDKLSKSLVYIFDNSGKSSQLLVSRLGSEVAEVSGKSGMLLLSTYLSTVSLLMTPHYRCRNHHLPREQHCQVRK